MYCTDVRCRIGPTANRSVAEIMAIANCPCRVSRCACDPNNSDFQAEPSPDRLQLLQLAATGQHKWYGSSGCPRARLEGMTHAYRAVIKASQIQAESSTASGEEHVQHVLDQLDPHELRAYLSPFFREGYQNDLAARSRAHSHRGQDGEAHGIALLVTGGVRTMLYKEAVNDWQGHLSSVKPPGMEMHAFAFLDIRDVDLRRHSQKPYNSTSAIQVYTNHARTQLHPALEGARALELYCIMTARLHTLQEHTGTTAHRTKSELPSSVSHLCCLQWALLPAPSVQLAEVKRVMARWGVLSFEMETEPLDGSRHPLSPRLVADCGVDERAFPSTEHPSGSWSNAGIAFRVLQFAKVEAATNMMRNAEARRGAMFALVVRLRSDLCLKPARHYLRFALSTLSQERPPPVTFAIADGAAVYGRWAADAYASFWRTVLICSFQTRCTHGHNASLPHTRAAFTWFQEFMGCTIRHDSPPRERCVDGGTRRTQHWVVGT